jgi:hypothetical protein
MSDLENFVQLITDDYVALGADKLKPKLIRTLDSRLLSVEMVADLVVALLQKAQLSRS